MAYKEYTNPHISKILAGMLVLLLAVSEDTQYDIFYLTHGWIGDTGLICFRNLLPLYVWGSRFLYPVAQRLLRRSLYL